MGHKMENVDARKRFDEHFVRSQRHIFRYIAALLPNRDHAEEVFQDTYTGPMKLDHDFRVKVV